MEKKIRKRKVNSYYVREIERRCEGDAAEFAESRYSMNNSKSWNELQ